MWKLILALIAFAGIAVLVVQQRNHDAPCTVFEELVLLADAQQQMQIYLASEGIAGNVEVREEGAFMLGAYPRSDVLWSVHIEEPEFSAETIALNAYCIRQGWVWITTVRPDAPPTITSFSQDQLAAMLRSQ